VLVPGLVPPQVQDFVLPLVEFVGAPALAGHEPGVMLRAASSHDSVQEKRFGHCCGEAGGRAELRELGAEGVVGRRTGLGR